MKRLIDDMSAADMKLSWARWGNGIDAWCEALCNPVLEWKDKIDPTDLDTWVLCFVTDNGSTSRHNVVWVQRYKASTYPFSCVQGGIHKYATPVDLSIRYEV